MSQEQIQRLPIDALIPYANNARVHSDKQILQIASSIKEFGFTNPVLIDKDNGIIAGHGRVEAARKLGHKEVPVIRLEHLSEAQKKAYILADNKIAMNSTWDDQLLALELQTIGDLGINLDFTGFDESEINELTQKEIAEDPLQNDESMYSNKVGSPVYQPEGPKPAIHDLYDKEKYLSLIQSIEKAVIPEEERSFLLDAATRHLQFNYQNIAEFYAHSAPTTQKLMEESALVIIDFDSAIEAGYAKLSDRLSQVYSREHEDEE